MRVYCVTKTKVVHKNGVSHSFKRSEVIKDENAHRLALSAKRGELLVSERERKRKFWDIIHGLPIIHSKD